MEKVFKETRDWKVTDYGIEYKVNTESDYKTKFSIHRSQVHDPEWESRMEAHSWVSIPDFMDALYFARVMFSDLINDGEEKYNG